MLGFMSRVLVAITFIWVGLLAPSARAIQGAGVGAARQPAEAISRADYVSRANSVCSQERSADHCSVGQVPQGPSQ